MAPRIDSLPGVAGVSARVIRRWARALSPDVGVLGDCGLHAAGGVVGARPGGPGPSGARFGGGFALAVEPRVRVRYPVVPPPEGRMVVACRRDDVHRPVARSSARSRDRRDRPGSSREWRAIRTIGRPNLLVVPRCIRSAPSSNHGRLTRIAILAETSTFT